MINKEYIVSSLDKIINILNDIKNSITKSKEEDLVTESVNGDVPVGKTFKFKGKEYIVKEVSNIEYACISENAVESICDLCAFDKNDNELCDQLCCEWFERHDHTEAYFVEKE